MRFNVFEPECPTRDLLDRVADKWTVLVISLLGDGPHRFGALRRGVGGISPKVLTEVLRSLERDGLVTRTVLPTSPVQVEYALTPLGRSLVELVRGLADWAEANMRRVLTARTKRASRSP